VVYKVRVRERAEVLRFKVLRRDWASESRLARLSGAIRLARSIQHPNLLPVLDLGQADGLTYLSCTFVRGMSLRQLIEVAGRMPASAVYLLARQLGAGLAEAHRLGLCHGGLKPEDVLIEPHGVVRLMDFGFTGPVELGADGAPAPGAAYLAPELIAGQDPGPATDVYGVGLLLFEMLTSQAAYHGTTPAEIRAEQTRPPVAPGTGLPQAFAPLVMRCLDAAPEKRFPSAADLLRALDQLSP